MNIKFKAKILLSLFAISGIFLKVSDFSSVYGMKRCGGYESQEANCKTSRVTEYGTHQLPVNRWFDLLAHADVAQLKGFLLMHGSECVNWSDVSGLSSLHHAVKSGDKNIVSLLLDYGANIDVVDKEHKTPLMYAVEMAVGGKQGYKDVAWDMAEFLCSNGADLNLSDVNGNTVLHKVAGNPNPWLYWILVSKGANTKMINKAGFTPEAIFSRCQRLCQLLASGGLGDSTASTDDTESIYGIGR